MNILVCAKRVPQALGPIALSADGREVDARLVGHTIGPHERCAVEEAVRIVNKEGGSSAVLTVGPGGAEDQLREAMAMGIDRAILLETEGGEWDPVSTAAAIAEGIAAQETAAGEFDLVFFGDAAADTGDSQVGVRVATALGRPVINGIIDIWFSDSRREVFARRQAPDGGWETYDLPLPAVLGVREGLNVPRYPSMPGRLEARKKELQRIPLGGSPSGALGLGAGEDAAGPDSAIPGPTMRRLRLPSAELTTDAPDARDRDARGSPSVGAARRNADRRHGDGRQAAVIAFVELLDGEPDARSVDALAFAGSLAARLDAPLDAILLGGSAERAARHLGAQCVGLAHVAADPRLDEYAPAAWAAAIADVVAIRAPSAVIAAATERGNEVLAHVAARLGAPMSANTLEVTPNASWLVTRERWGGSLLEDASLDAPVRLLTVAARAVVEESPRAPRAAPTITRFEPELQPADLVARVVSREPKPSSPAG
jgi:electron transfer flavoprotein beta subunit